ncbi:MAG: tetratricopeptide repeat protein [Candidatus Levybacteria bacterium]|nr:tetratricopeptide repeat protein [Candidatus Levybacteria bacterium]
MESKNEISAYLENISILLLGLILFGLPLVFTTLTTDAFTLPKQILLIVGGLVLLLLSGARMISEGSVRIRRTPFDIALAVFGVVLLASAILSINRIDSILAVVPAIFAIISFFLIINLAKNRPSMTFLVTALLSGSAIAALVSILSYAKVYVLPMPFTKVPEFTTFGTMLDQAMYLVFLLPIVGYFVYSIVRHLQTTRFGRTSSSASSKTVLTGNPIGMGFAGVVLVLLAAALAVSGYQLFLQRPLLLPFDTGFQTAFAAISQDTGRTLQGFLFGSGFGTYSTDFTRFKMASFNLNSNLWTLTFFRSSSFVLELLATTGLAGILSFGFVLYTIFKSVRENMSKKGYTNPLVISVILVAIASLVLPFSPIIVIMFFVLLGLYAAENRLEAATRSKEYFDVELHFVAFTEGFIPVTATPVTEGDHRVQKDYTKILPVTLFILFVGFVAVVGFFTYSFTYSDIIFQRSLVAASQNNGLQTYTDQITAIRAFPYRDAYYRIASQTDLALANSLASSIPAGSSPSAQIQQNVTQLIQEAISTGRTATQLAPATAVNWQNLSSVYRGLIGFGQNADQFAIATQQQAIALNPNDPQGYINLGGIYYQLGLWDNAQQSFQTAVSLKPDYANAYYNLGHALESKGDLTNALTTYETVKTLIANDKEGTKKMDTEIKALQEKIGSAKQTQEEQSQATQEQATNQEQQPSVGLNQPETQLPEQKNPVKLPSPAVTAEPSPSASPTPGQ